MESVIRLIINSAVILWALVRIVQILYYDMLPKKDAVDVKKIPKSYFIETSNRIDIQNHNECAAFSSAYVLRHFGEEADGNKIYSGYPRKVRSGEIYPKGIIIYFKNHSYKALFLKGNINTLKKQVSKGTPVIVFISVTPNKRVLHFAPVTGYDEENLYLADSAKLAINCNEKNYNRKIPIKDFEIMWATGMKRFYKNTYIVISE